MKRILIQILLLILAISTTALATDRFTDMGNGTVLDTNTSLLWLKNANCSGQGWGYDNAILVAANVANGQCGLSDGSIAGQWSLPGSQTLKNFSDAARSLGWSPFTNVALALANPYWAGGASYGSYATCVVLSTGYVNSSSNKNYYYNVWPYRPAGPLDVLAVSATGTMETFMNIGMNDLVTYTISSIGINPVSLEQAAITGATGSGFSITNDTCSNTSLSPGENCSVTLKVEPTAPGSLSSTISVPYSTAGSATNRTISSPSVTVIATISGTITDSSTGNGLAGATVTLSSGQTTTTDANGAYIFNPAPAANTRSVAFSKAGYGGTTTSNVTNSASVGAIVNTHLTPTGLFNILGASFAPQQNIPFSGQVKITGGTGPYTFSVVSSSLPSGLSLDAATGIISGTATIVGSYPITVRVKDSGTGLAELGGTIEVQAPLAFATVTPIAGATINTAYSGAISATGGKAPYTYTINSGALPTGLSFNTGTGAITGTPTVIQNNVITCTVTDALGRTKSDTFMLGVGNALTITPTRMNDGIVGIAYTGPAPTGTNIVGKPTWSIAAGSSLPAGLAINAATGAFSGTPTTALNQTVKLLLKDGIARTVTKDVTFNVVPALQISLATLPDGYLNYAYSTTASASGGFAPYNHTLGGSLIAGLTLNSLTGTISGTPTASGLTNVSITAKDATWPTPQSTTNNYSLRVNAQATLSITKAGTGTGGVTTNSGTITWVGNSGTVGYAASNNTVILTAAPNANSVFTGWGGVCSGTGTCSVAMNAAKSVTAAFTYMSPVNGVCGSNNGTTITTIPTGNLCTSGIATAVTGTGPWNWSCNGQFTGTNAACSASIQTYSMSFISGANGTLTGTTSQTVNHGSSATALTAVPSTGYHFVSWTGTGGFVTTTANPLTVTSVTSAKTITANFAINTYSVTFTSGGNGTLTGTSSQTINHGSSSTTVTAVPATGYHLVNWTGTGGIVTTTANPITVTSVTSAKTITANFAINTYSVNFASSGNGTLTGTSSQAINHGSSSTTVTAVPATGYHFVSWTGTGGFVTTTSNPLLVSNVTAAQTITANFAVTPTAGTCGSGNGTAFRIVPTTNLCATGTATAVTGTGPWSWSCNGQPGGANANCSAAIDITGPTLTISTLTNGAKTNNTTLNISGTVVDTNGVGSLTINGAAVTVTSGSYSYPFILQAGANTITTIATDTLGNSSTVTRTITLDTTAPTLTIAAPADNSNTAQLLATTTGTINETSTVTVKVGSATPQSAAITGNSYSATVNLASGLNTITITATDMAGNTTSAVRSITYDNTNPSLAITNPSQDITTNQSSIAITGTVSDTLTSTTVKVAFNNQDYMPAITNGIFSQQLTFPAVGTYAITATATDEAGNSSSATRNLIYQLPKSGIVNPSSGKTRPDLSDALRVLNIATGKITPTAADYDQGDIAPLDSSGKPKGNNVIDTYDAIGILRMVAGLL